MIDTGAWRNNWRAPRRPRTSGACCRSWGIGYIQARSPQAKGRIERLWGTLQDRLVSELRLHRIATRAAANAFLPAFLADFNRRFSRAAQQVQPVWRRPPRALELVLSCRYARVVARDNTVRVGPRLLQIPRGPAGRSYTRRRVDIRELLDGRVVILVDATIIARVAAPAGAFTLTPRRGPHADRPAARRPARAAASRPLRHALAALATALPPALPRRHPWRLGYDPQRALRAGYPRHRG